MKNKIIRKIRLTQEIGKQGTSQAGNTKIDVIRHEKDVYSWRLLLNGEMTKIYVARSKIN
jgi:hypothetical protein